MEPICLVHGGTNAPLEWVDGCEAASLAGLEVLRGGGSALDAVVAAVRRLEDDGRFNAGRGSFLRLDGETIETDAGVMDSDGRIGAVAALRGFRHPVDAARAVLNSPHVLLAGPGASLFAGRRGLEEWTEGPTKAARERHRRVLALLRDKTTRRPEWRDADLASLWNFPGPLPEELRPKDTVGAVARDHRGTFAAANSTGGAVPMLLGRVGDSPLPGAGFWAGPEGAVATTGVGEEIIRRLAAREVSRLLASGLSVTGAIEQVTGHFPDFMAFGAVAVSASDHGAAANRTLPWAAAAP